LGKEIEIGNTQNRISIYLAKSIGEYGVQTRHLIKDRCNDKEFALKNKRKYFIGRFLAK
jgi:hypothetical protein